MRYVFIIGSKGIPAKYGGYETFIDNWITHFQDINYCFNVSCLADNSGSFQYDKANCFNVKVPKLGPATAFFYDWLALKKVIKQIKINKIKKPIIYICACRIGLFFNSLSRRLHKLNGTIIINPDGHDWMRKKWPLIVRKYLKYSEKKMIKKSDLIVCDSLGIEEYMKKQYSKYNIKTSYISYGSDISKSTLKSTDKIFQDWMKKNNIKEGEFFLSVGRFVPENNFELMIREFMSSKTAKDFVLITNVKKNKFYKKLEKKYHFSNDARIKFVGTVYDKQLLKKIREEAFAYLHGHSVGGTNPSLLEALSSTKVNILLDVVFNKECARESAIYYNYEKGSLKKAIEYSETLDAKEINHLYQLSLNEVSTRYNWDDVAKKYELLLNEIK